MGNASVFKIGAYYCFAHQKAVSLVADLTDEQIAWRPDPASLSIAFHFWHLARWADHLHATIPSEYPALARLLDQNRQIWETENLASQWGLDTDFLGIEQTGMEMDSEAAARLSLPGKAILLEYAGCTFAAAESLVYRIEALDFDPDQSDGEQHAALLTARATVMEYLIHDNRHLGMMECIKGILTGRGTATR